MKREILRGCLHSVKRAAMLYPRVACALLALWAASAVAQSTSAEIKQAIIRDSIAAYPRDCPCPYSVRNGSECRLKSAYSRSGGRAVQCFPSDVSEEMIKT